jgi:hypothetical protein
MVSLEKRPTDKEIKMEEYKVMDYQKYSEFVETDGTHEIGKYDELTDAVEIATQFEENPNKWGLPSGVTSEIIQLVTEDPLSHLGGNNIVPDGWIVVIHTPKDPELDKQTDNNMSSHSEQRNKDLTKLDIENDSFPHKKGKGTNPNSLKNLKPFKKGQSGNPGGKPVKFAQLKKVLDEWGDKTDDDNWSWGNYTNRQMVIKGIWERASKGNRSDLDVLLQLGLLDEETFK